MEKVRREYPKERVPEIKEEDYKEALSVILSRAFQAADGSPYLCPILDMMNSNLKSMTIHYFVFN